jgi:RimJ/RimL family protein N-acetyltransferase
MIPRPDAPRWVNYECEWFAQRQRLDNRRTSRLHVLAMLFTPVRVSLRENRSATVRMASADDDAALLDLERAIVRDRHGIVKHEDELPADAPAYAEQRKSAGVTATDGSAFCLVAEEDGHGIVAEAYFLRHRFRMIRHVATLGIDVHPAAQGIGLGRALLGRLLAWVRAHRDADGERVLRAELNVRADNPRAIALYRSLGFELEGTRRAFVRRDDGALVDDHTMGLLLYA